MSKHTPGPWRVYPYVQHAGQFGIEAKDDFGLRVEVGQTFMVLHGDPLANARLIAAAPELLEALIWAVDRLDALAQHSEERKSALAVIAKAMGEA